jgi:hypothetical protein
MSETDWSDVERLISDLKADGYDPSLLETTTDAAVPQKMIQINVERPADTATEPEGSGDE